MTSIEYCHVYTNKGVSSSALNSISILNSLLSDIKDDYQLVVMVDDYSHREVDHFDYKSFLSLLDKQGSPPSVMIKESSLLEANDETVKKLISGSVKKSLVKTIKRTGLHPCSLFIATWYLIRLGEIPFDRSLNIKDGDIKKADKLINILPICFKSYEKKAKKILKKIGIETGRIQNIYFDTDWDCFDPDQYVQNNYSKIHLEDVSIVYSLISHYKKEPTKKASLLEIGCGPNLYPLLCAIPFFKEVHVYEIGKKNIEYLKKELQGMSKCWERFIALIKVLFDDLSDYDFAKNLKEKVKIHNKGFYELENESKTYEYISSHFVAESITEDKKEVDNFCAIMQKSLSVNGGIVASFMLGSNGYKIGNKSYPSCNINSDDVNTFFKRSENLKTTIFSSRDRIRDGYNEILFLTARRANVPRGTYQNK